jgi:hypothetical protein
LFDRLNGRVSEQALFSADTLADKSLSDPRQMVGTVRVHPGGRFVYVANRGDQKKDDGGQKVFAGGENTIAVYEIDPATGAPRLIQHVDTGGIHCRNFQFDPSGRIMVGSHVYTIKVRQGEKIVTVLPRISVFRVGDDGRLTIMKTHDIDTAGRRIFWMGLHAL